MNMVKYAIPYIPLAIFFIVYISDQFIVPYIIIKKAGKLFKSKEYDKCFFMLSQYSLKLKSREIKNGIQYMIFTNATRMKDKERQVNALKEIRVEAGSHKKFVYLYLQWLLRFYCLEDKELIEAASMGFHPKGIGKKAELSMRLLSCLKADYEGEKVNEDDVLLLLAGLPDDELKVAYYLLAKISGAEDRAKYLKEARALSENTYIDELLNGLNGEKK